MSRLDRHATRRSSPTRRPASPWRVDQLEHRRGRRRRPRAGPGRPAPRRPLATRPVGRRAAPWPAAPPAGRSAAIALCRAHLLHHADGRVEHDHGDDDDGVRQVAEPDDHGQRTEQQQDHRIPQLTDHPGQQAAPGCGGGRFGPWIRQPLGCLRRRSGLRRRRGVDGHVPVAPADTWSGETPRRGWSPGGDGTTRTVHWAARRTARAVPPRWNPAATRCGRRITMSRSACSDARTSA